MKYRKVPDETVRRLPVYLRAVIYFSRQGIRSVSSEKLAGLLGVNSWQIRKDFSYFGEFGIPGVGYDIKSLIIHIKRILQLNTAHRAALVGVGNLGSALMAYSGFSIYGFEIAAAFDIDRKKIGRKQSGVVIEDAARLHILKERKIRLGIIAVPAEAAQDIADGLVRAGVKGILNFSPRYITVPRKIKVITIDIAMDLARLPYYCFIAD
jgi:redox-sensing transcriptional repressor